ncbi:MAG TPA: hypothetical protein ENI70_01710, partial [Candidatus Peregrinibacteria bacterium]|nr:hypothetical protein [Candidatus Peregrinibacteria bacterium]
TISNTRFSDINKLAKEILSENGNVMTEENLTNEILKRILSKQDVDGHIIRLSMVVDPELEKQDKTDAFFPFWRYKTIDVEEIRKVIESAISILKKKGDTLLEPKLIGEIQNIFARKGNKQVEEKTVLGCLTTDKRLKKVEEGWGLMEWRHINPRSIRDKAYIVLKNHKKPLHFVEIANKISEVGFDKKVVTVQAVHNELIRCEKFVLVGRGLYVLKEWGYKEGTVADVIEEILAKKNGPMTKQEIIEEVLKQRHVRIGTISLNLQKNPHFARVGRAVYELDISKKPKSSKKK